VGDMALFLFSRGIKPADVVNLEPGSMPFPESVIDMLSGGLGWPEGGWPERVSLAVLGPERHARARAAYARAVRGEREARTARVRKSARRAARTAVDPLAPQRAALSAQLHRTPTDDELFSHLMYPQVFAAFARHRREFSDVGVLPTPAFFYGLVP